MCTCWTGLRRKRRRLRIRRRRLRRRPRRRLRPRQRPITMWSMVMCRKSRRPIRRRRPLRSWSIASRQSRPKWRRSRRMRAPRSATRAIPCTIRPCLRSIRRIKRRSYSSWRSRRRGGTSLSSSLNVSAIEIRLINNKENSNHFEYFVKLTNLCL